MNKVWMQQAKSLYDISEIMVKKCVLYIQDGGRACDECFECSSQCCAADTRRWIEKRYVERGGDLLSLRAVRQKDGKIRINL